MKPHVTCHMLSSVDGRIVATQWPLRNAAVFGGKRQLNLNWVKRLRGGIIWSRYQVLNR